MSIFKTISYLRFIFLFAGMFLAVDNAKAIDEMSLKIYTVNYPLKFFAETISGNHATVILPMQADIDPAFWSPKAEDINSLQKADLILLNGANYAKWLPKVSLPLFKMANTSSGFRDAYIVLESAIKHNHGAGGEHSHTGTAFTTWLDFSQAAQQAEAVFKAISNKKPDLSTIFEQNLIPLQQSLHEIDMDLSQIGWALEGQALLGSHPVYQYLKRRYQLNLKSVHWEPEEIPSDSQWALLQQILKNHPAQWMLWEGEPAPETVRRLESIGVKSIVFSPIANMPEQGDFISEMRKNVARLKKAINNNESVQ